MGFFNTLKFIIYAQFDWLYIANLVSPNFRDAIRNGQTMCYCSALCAAPVSLSDFFFLSLLWIHTKLLEILFNLEVMQFFQLLAVILFMCSTIFSKRVRGTAASLRFCGKCVLVTCETC